jgi:RNA polymerase sigma-70 factor (ECF subfamily)
MRARSGDPRALERLVGRYLPRLHRWTHGRLPRWTRTISDTTDLIQEAALRVFCRLDAFDIRSTRALAAYLHATVRNRIRDEHRRHARRGAHDVEPETLGDGAPSPFDIASSREAEARYRAALAQIPPPDRELIVAHFELGYTHEQLGCMTGRSGNAARVALQRAVRRLAERMGDG